LEPVVATEEVPEQVVDSVGAEVISATRTDEGLAHFVIVLQRCYRRYRARRELVESSSLHQVYQTCAQRAKAIEFGLEKEPKHRSHYLAILRGPLPHVLSVLSSLVNLIRKTRNAAKRRLSKADPGPEMEKCFEHVNNLNATYREVTKVKKSMEPGSRAFCSGNSNDLKTLVAKAKVLLDDSTTYLKLAASDVKSLQEDMAIAIKGIVTDPAPPKKKEKPSLNTDDLDCEWVENIHGDS